MALEGSLGDTLGLDLGDWGLSCLDRHGIQSSSFGSWGVGACMEWVGTQRILDSHTLQGTPSVYGMALLEMSECVVLRAPGLMTVPKPAKALAGGRLYIDLAWAGWPAQHALELLCVMGNLCRCTRP